MPRRLRSEPTIIPTVTRATVDTSALTNGEPRVVQVQVGVSTRLVTLDASAGRWEGRGGLPDVGGAIVRLRPPAGADAALVDAVRREAVEAGAVAVKVLPIPVSKVQVVPMQAPTRRGARDVVLAMASESKSTHREELVQVVERICDEVGL